MPPKDINKMPTLFVETSSGKRVELGSISDWEMTTEPQIIDGDTVISTCPDELTLEVKQSYLTPDTIYCLIHGRIPSNNWLKAHGWPLRRKAGRFSGGKNGKTQRRRNLQSC